MRGSNPSIYSTANGNELTKKDYLCNQTTNVYDGINRLVETRDPYDKIVQQILYNDADAQISSYDAMNHETKFLYDKNMRQTGTIDAEEKISSVTYDTRGNVSTRTDGNGNTTTYQYDGEDHLTKVTDALGNNTLYTYDAAGNLRSQTDGNSNTTNYQYNTANLLKTKTDPAGISESYTYYTNGLMATKTDRNGIITSYTYDIFGRLLTEDCGGEIQSYTYDSNNNRLTMTDSTGTTAWTYDFLNRSTTKTVPVIGQSIYKYDLAAATEGEYSERTTDPKGNVTVKTYDKAGRLSKVTVGTDTTVYQYNANGTRNSVTYPGGITETYTYYKNNQVKGLTNTKADGTISSYQYTYDDAGNQLTKTEAKGTTTYTYDSLNRLSTVAEPDGKTTGYTYDGAGNRKTEHIEKGLVSETTIYAYDSRNRLTSTLSSDGAETQYLYDNNGNQISKTVGTIKTVTAENMTAENRPGFDLIIKHGDQNGTGTESQTTYAYDHYNRLIKTEYNHSTSTYNYNAQGYRVYKKVNSTTTEYLYEGDKVVLETDENNVQKARQVYGSNLLYRSTTADGSTGAQSYYYLYNAHGDVTALVDASGNTAVTYDYDAFGNITNQTGTANNSIKYAGYQQDEESGLYYLNARYYDSVTARFITEDDPKYSKTSDPLSLNLYTYCNNEPIMYTDPDGHLAHIVVGAAIGALVNTALTAVDDYMDDGEFNKDWTEYAGAAAEGAITGGVAAATGGASLAVTISAGAAASGAGNAARQYISTGKVDAKKVVYAAASDAVAGVAGHVASVAVKKVTNNIVKTAASKADDVASKGKNSISSVVSKSKGASKNLPVKYDSDFAAKQILNSPTNVTKGGNKITAHAAERMVNPPAGRAPTTMKEVDNFLKTATEVKKVSPHPMGDTITLRNSTSSIKEVVVDAKTGKKVITVINPAKKGK